MPNTWKLPPFEKLPEACSALAPGRILAAGEGKWTVLSSDGSKSYTVTRDETGAYSSDDNGSRWQGYAGYPILAVMLLRKELTLPDEVIRLFAGIDWQSLNKEYKRDYAAALQHVMENFPPEVDRSAVTASLQSAYEVVKNSLPLRKGGKSVFSAPVPESKLAPVPLEEPVVTEDALVPGTAYGFFAGPDGFAFSPDGIKVRICTELPENISSLTLLGYDTKHFFRQYGTETGVRFADDVLLGGWLSDSSDSDGSLERLTEKYLNRTLQKEFSAGEGAIAVFRLSQVLKERLKKDGMTALLREMELPLAPVLAEMERSGIRFEEKALPGYGESLASSAEAEKRKVFELTGETFNLNSPKQLGSVLFEKLKLPAGKKTRSGYSTDMEVLETLKEAHPAIIPLISYRKIEKLRSTYAETLPKLTGPDGRIHTTYNMTSTATGRLSSVSPNLQNIPVRSELGGEIRKMFLPSEGNCLVSADYSQIELRILAHISGDPVMQEAFRSGKDIHAATASQVFGVPLESVSKEMRSRAKAVNFGIVYGISAFSLAKDLEISRKEAADYIDGYLARYSGVAEYLKRSVAEAKERGYALTIAGRRRYLPELTSGDARIRAFGERAAMNSPIQGSAADIIKAAMLKVSSALKERFPEAKMLLQIHDELILDVPVSCAEEVKKLLREQMENVMPLAVPLPVDVSSGNNWYEI